MRVFSWLVPVVAGIEILVLVSLKATAWAYLIAVAVTIVFFVVLKPLAKEYDRRANL